MKDFCFSETTTLKIAIELSKERVGGSKRLIGYRLPTCPPAPLIGSVKVCLGKWG